MATEFSYKCMFGIETLRINCHDGRLIEIPVDVGTAPAAHLMMGFMVETLNKHFDADHQRESKDGCKAHI